MTERIGVHGGGFTVVERGDVVDLLRVSAKSKMSAFCRSRCKVADFGIATRPSSMFQHRMTDRLRDDAFGLGVVHRRGAESEVRDVGAVRQADNGGGHG